MADQPKKQNPPFSLRFTFEERAQLEKDAAGMSLGAYIRSRIFDENLPKRRTRGKYPVKDHQELGKLLGELGRSRIANNLNQLAKAANSGSLEVSPDTEQAIQDGCNEINCPLISRRSIYDNESLLLRLQDNENHRNTGR